MCLVLAPIIPFIPLLTGGAVSAPQSPPQQQIQQNQQNQPNDQNQQTEENPNDIENIEDFMSRFGRTYASPAEQLFRQGVFTQNLGIINVSFKRFLELDCISSCSLQAHNALFAAGAQTYFLRMNQFGDRTLEEISAEYTGLGLLSSAPASLAPSQVTQGQLPVNYNPPRSVDTEGGCRTAVTEEQQQWSRFQFLMAYIPKSQFLTFLILFPNKLTKNTKKKRNLIRLVYGQVTLCSLSPCSLI